VGTWLSLVEHSLGVRGVGSSNLPVPTILVHKQVLRFAQDFACGLPLHFVPLTPAKRLNLGCEGSAVQICPSRPFLFTNRSFARSGFRLRSPAPLRSAHARKTAQLGVRGVGSSNLPIP